MQSATNGMHLISQTVYIPLGVSLQRSDGRVIDLCTTETKLVSVKTPRAECFEHVATRWSDDELKKAPEEWYGFRKRYNEHKSCTRAKACSNCKKEFCSHLSNHIGKNVCAWCDDHSQPYLANPVNKQSCCQYLSPKQFELIYPGTRTRSIMKSMKAMKAME